MPVPGDIWEHHGHVARLQHLLYQLHKLFAYTDTAPHDVVQMLAATVVITQVVLPYAIAHSLFLVLFHPACMRVSIKFPVPVHYS